jgi:hypothetical protein
MTPAFAESLAMLAIAAAALAVSLVGLLVVGVLQAVIISGLVRAVRARDRKKWETWAAQQRARTRERGP